MALLNATAQLLFLLSLGGLIWLVVVAFKRNILWGIGVLLLSPITASIYALLYWPESKKPFALYATTLLAGFISVAVLFTSAGGFQVMNASMNASNLAGDEQAAFDFAHATLDFIENTDESQAGEVAAMRDFVEKMEAGAPNEAACGLYQQALQNSQSDKDRQIIRQNMRELGCDMAVPQADTASVDESIADAGAAEADPSEDSRSLKPLLREPPVRYQQVFMPIEIASAADHIGRPVIVTHRGRRPQECKLLAIDAGSLTFEQRVGSGTMTFSYDREDIRSLEAQFTVPESQG